MTKIKQEDSSEWFGPGIVVGLVSMGLLWWGTSCVGEYNEDLYDLRNRVERLERDMAYPLRWMEEVSKGSDCHFEAGSLNGDWRVIGCTPKEEKK